MNLAQITGEGDKTCYIAQPFGYNYTLVNQFQNGITGIAVDGRIQVVNKPMTVSVFRLYCRIIEPGKWIRQLIAFLLYLSIPRTRSQASASSVTCVGLCSTSWST